MRYILAHDLGTSGNKATLFDEKGRLIASKVSAYGVNFFNNNWAEQNADDWWEAAASSTRALIESSGVNAADIAAVSFSGQMMGCLCVDKEGKPLRPSVIWADQRSTRQVEELRGKISDGEFYTLTGQPNSPSYGMQKLMWIKENQPDIYKETYKALNSKDYIVFKLTGKIYTEYSDASGFALLDLNKYAWSERLLEYAGLDGDKLPELKPSTFIAGGVTKEAAQKTGLAEGTPVVLGGGDGLCASVGAGSIGPGRAYCCVGTSSWAGAASEQPLNDPKRRFVNFAHIVPGMFSPIGSMQAGGGAYSWFKNTVCVSECEKAARLGISPYDLINEQAATSPAGSNGLIFMPYLLGERAPRWDTEAKGCYIGLKMETSRADMQRAVLEGVAMNLSLIFAGYAECGLDFDSALIIGGGAKSALWRQIFADVFGKKVKTPRVLEEATSMGAAVTGGVGAGVFKDFTAIDDFIEITHEHVPDAKNAEVYAELVKVFDRSYFALKDIFPQLSKF